MSARAAARDARLGERWTLAQRAKNALIAATVRAGLVLLVPLPRAWLRGIGRALGVVALFMFPRARRTAYGNLARVFPAMPDRARRALVRRNYLTLGAHLGDALASLHVARPLDPLPIDDASLALLTAGDRGVLFASAHLGPWERVAATLVARGVPLTIVAREPYDPRLDVVYRRLRSDRGLRVVYRGQPGAGIAIPRVLRSRRVLGIPMDLATRAPSIASTLFGLPARTAIGPARIALRTGASVVVGTVAPREDGSLAITCAPIDTHDLAPDTYGERALTARINQELARRISALPAHWLWAHPRFDDIVVCVATEEAPLSVTSGGMPVD